MKLATLVMISTFVVLIHQSPVVGQSGGSDATEIKFAADTEAPVITLTIFGGYRKASDAGDAIKPRVQIWPSGKVVCPATKTTQKVEGKLTQKELRELLKFIVEEKGAYALSKQLINKKIEEAGKKIYITDAPTTKIEISLERGKHALEIFAADFSIRLVPELKELKDAIAIQQRLEQIVTEIQAGR